MSSNENKEEILIEIIEINDEIQQTATNFGNLTNQVNQKEEEIKDQKNKLEIVMKMKFGRRNLKSTKSLKKTRNRIIPNL